MEKTAASLPRPSGINHVAYRCRDADQTRWFYEDILGLPLVTAPVFEEVPGTGDRIPYMHLFFELGNGEMIAFFDQPGTAEESKFARTHSFERHLALEVADEEVLLAWQKRINDAGVTCVGPIHHGFVKSIYMYDPNGLQVELTCRTEGWDAEMSNPERTQASMAGWRHRMRGMKERRFGSAAIDARSKRPPRTGRS